MVEEHDETGLFTTTWPGEQGAPAVVLLHGSGQDETSLLDFARAACPGHALIAVRGRVPWEEGFAFFRRRPDRTLDEDDLAHGAAALHRLLLRLDREGQRPPVLLGYSNGAIVAAAALLLEHRLTAATILLRPLSPWPERTFPDLANYSVLLVGAEDDERRGPRDGPVLRDQLHAAGAVAELQTLAVGHPLTSADEAVVRQWSGNLTADEVAHESTLSSEGCSGTAL